jgi:hypothetical protein
MFTFHTSLEGTSGVKVGNRVVLGGLCALLLSSIAVAGPTYQGGPVVSASRHKVQVNDSNGAAQVVALGGKLVADYGSYQLYEVPQVNSTLPASQEIEFRDQYNFVMLNAGLLDTSKPEVQAARKTVSSFSGKRLHLVQFAGPVQPSWREALLETGVQIVSYVPQNAYLVYGDAPAIDRLQGLATKASHVQWDGAYLDEYKVHPAANPVDALGRPRDIGTEEFAIQLVTDPEANPKSLALLERLKLRPIRRQSTVLNYHNIVIPLRPADLSLVAAQPEVVSIQPYLLHTKFDERQAQISIGNLAGNQPAGPGYLAWLTSKGFTQQQFTNSAFAVDVTDSGLDNGTLTPNHPGLYPLGDTNQTSRVAYNRLEGSPNNPGSTIKGCDGHGTLNSHIVGGYDDITGFPHSDTAGYHYGLGICPFVRVGSSVIFDPDYFTYPIYADLQSRAYRDGARVSNNSWGSHAFGDYDMDSQEYDALVRDAQPEGAAVSAPGNQEMVIVFSAGNDGDYGYQTIGSPGTGKNVLTVGASENVQPMGGSDGCGTSDSEANSANDMAVFSSRGPCTDGRHKPEIVAPGTHVSGGVAQAPNPAPDGTADPCFLANGWGICGTMTSLFFPAGQQLFTVSTGTSHSGPGVAGACALLRQYFINTFGTPPSAAMTKAYLVNSTRYLNGVLANDSLWSDTQGMGAMNLGTALDDTVRVVRDQLTNDLFTASGQTRTFTGTIMNPGKPFRVTIAWTDSPGNTFGNAYNNNLDLTVTVGGNTYKGNVFNGANSSTGGTPDTANNVESVFLGTAPAGTFAVTVKAVNINSDGIPNNDSPLDQDFALVIYNGALVVAPSISVQPTNTTALIDYPVALSVLASGTAPMTYQWRKDGRDLSGATTNTFRIAAAKMSDAGLYSVRIANSLGTTNSDTVSLIVVPTVPLPFALNNTNFNWVVETNTPWYGQTNMAYDGVASGRSYFIGDSQQTGLTAVTNGPGTLSFWWKVSSQTNADFLSFTSLGSGITNTSQISGEVDWTKVTVYLPVGLQTLVWSYSKDDSLSVSNDAGYVDQVSYVPGPSSPEILSPPASQSALATQPVELNVLAAGTPPLAYQWLFNGNDITGATLDSFTITNAVATDSGLYSVRVANAFGAVLSAEAYVGIVPLILSGDDSFGQVDVSLNATNVVGIAAGAWHSVALRANGTVLAWGDNFDGQCDVPASLTDAIGVAAGGYHNLALTLNGRVVGWGANSSGQAAPPAGLSNAIAIAAGTWHSLALRGDGTVAAWGDNSLGQITIPPNLTNIIAVAAGGSHSLALRANGTVVAWGDNMNAQGDFSGQSVVPWGLNNVVAIGAGDYHSLAVKADGSVLAWGDNSQAQAQVPAELGKVVAVAGGGAHTVALKSDTTVAAWGEDWNGQCKLPSNATNVIAVAAGNSHTLLLLGTAASAPQILRAYRTGTEFRVLVPTFAGKTYALEYKDTLALANWTSLPAIHGNGAIQVLVDPAASGPHRLYRVRQW